MSAAGNDAVFLSYASQDAAAARRICEALRSGGMEVWFDADGGLEHGDEWDAKIRRQIKECVLFIPVISANTQARHEGYFRIEWDLAAERARGIASGVPFILPVVIDDTREPDALVPDRFRTVQWTRLRGGEVPPEVKARYLKLWAHRTGVLRHEAATAAPRESLAPGIPARPRSRPGLWLGGGVALAAVVIVACVFIFQGRKAPVPQDAASRAAPASGTVAAVNEVDQFVKQARDIIYEPDSGRADFALAENFLKRATDLAPASGAAWGASALLQHYFYSRAYDVDKQRLVRSQAEAEKTLRLDPDNTDALLALGLHRQLLGERERARDYLRRASAADPQNSRAILALAAQVRGLSARAKFMLDAAAGVARPAEIYYDASLLYLNLRRFDEAARACDRAIASQPFWRTFVMRANIEKLQSADPARINAWLDRVPELKRDEPRVVLLRYNAAMLRRDHAAAVRVLSGVAVGFFEDNFFLGPKAYLLAPAYELAGQRDRAAEQWHMAERSLREKVLAEPQRTVWRPMLAVTLAAQGRTTEGESAVDSCAGDERVMSEVKSIEYTAEAFLRLGRSARAIELLQTAAGQHGWHFVSAATLAADPRWESLRALPEYGALLAALKLAETEDIARSLTSATPPEEESVPPPAAASSPNSDLSSPSRSPAADAKSVAVLAFKNLSDDKGNESFSDGISEELGVVLGKVPGLRVAGWNSALSFKGKNVRESEIAQKLGVTHIVSGSVQKSGPQVRITARLVNAADGFSLWTDSFRREAKDIFAVQDEIAGLIAQNLQLTLGVGARRTRTVNPEAHRLVLEGRHYWNQRNDAGFARAEASFLKAIDLDPGFAEAHAGLAGVYVVRADYRELPTTSERVVDDTRKARRAAERAVELGSNLAEANAVLAYVQMIQGEHRAAESSFVRALTINPQLAMTNMWYAVWHKANGRLDSALEFFAKVVAIDPLWFINLHLYAEALFYAGRYEEALKTCDRAISLRPDVFVPSLGLRAQILFALNRRDDALQVARAIRLNKSADTRWHADGGAIRIIRLNGHEAEAREFTTEVLQRLDLQSPVRPHVFASAGDFESALAAVGDTRMTQRRYYFWEPIWDPWRDDPRFRAALTKLGCADEYKIARETVARLKLESEAKK